MKSITTMLSSTTLLLCTSAAFAGPQAAATRATVLHVPPSEATAREPLRLLAVVDQGWTQASLVLRYRESGAPQKYSAIAFERSSAGGHHAIIPAEQVNRPGVEYYISGLLSSGRETLHFGSPAEPHLVSVSPTAEVRWAEKERQRLHGLVSSMSVSVAGHDFNNRFGKQDRYIRGDVHWTHRLLTRLYAITLGYGFIEGRTPNGEDNDAQVERKGARYGYAGVTLRLRESVYLDGQTAIGVSRDEVIVGGRAVLTLGKPWKSSVDLGAELFEELGPSVFVRLQWDTVAPFLMGASIIKTDLPDATLRGGAFIRYDIQYPISRRITLRGAISFGSRDGPGQFGGGLGTSFAF